MVWSEGNMSLKNPVTPPGIDPGTVRLVAQRLNQYATPGPNETGIHVLIELAISGHRNVTTKEAEKTIKYEEYMI